MDYKARFYDPTIGRFIQPDTIVPAPTNPQSWNRYAYTLNNPIRYNDPAGHRNCEEDGYNCPGDKDWDNSDWRTPGELMQHHKLDKDKTELNREIDNYLRTHPDYQPDNDPYLRFSIGDNRELAFEDLRLNYWQGRLKESGVCKSQYFCVDQAEDLYKYYDLHQHVRGPEAWDSSRVSWPSVALDIAGIPLSLVGLGPLKPTTQVGARILFWTGIADNGVSVATANNPLKRVIALGGAVPVAGALFDLNLAMWDLGEGTYYLPYTPPISR